MRRLCVFLVAAALVSLLLASVASGDKGGTNRPFTATLAGAVTYAVPAGCPGNPPSLGNCLKFETLTDGTGQATHLGRVGVHMSHFPYDFANTHDGSMTLIAANGDELHGVYDYDLLSASPTIPVTLTGGTGRFADASGTIFFTAEVIMQFKPIPPCDPGTDFFGCLNPDVPWPWSATVTGAISY